MTDAPDALTRRGLRKVPRQARSRARVDAIVDALLALVADGRAEDITTTDIAERAGVPIGSLYEYFEDRDGVVDAAVARMVLRHDHALAKVDLDRSIDPAELVDELVETYLWLYAGDEAFVALRLSPLFKPEHAALFQERVDAFVARMGASGAASGWLRNDRRTGRRLRLVFTLGDAILITWFRSPSPRDRAVLDDGRAILRFAFERIAMPPAKSAGRAAVRARPR